MEYLFEFLLELILEGSIEASQNPKVPKGIRYLLITIVSLFFLSVIGLIFFTGTLMLKENFVLGILFYALGFCMLLMGILKFRKVYIKKTNQKQEELEWKKR